MGQNRLIKIGDRFSYLVTLERLENDVYRNSRWLCRCECGNTKIITGNNLLSGNSKTCGQCKVSKQVPCVEMELPLDFPVSVADLMPFSEIGRRIGVSEGTAKKIFADGMQKLRQTLREYDGTAEDLFSFLECDTPRLPGIKTRAPNVLWFGSSLDCTTHPEDSTDDQITGSGLEP